jgi:hypothetical protein
VTRDIHNNNNNNNNNNNQIIDYELSGVSAVGKN